ncbi:hypothetical protein [Anabaena sp. UHCC 0204]|uniref:hypothetical protein n=1 Tax=Anabaena sp. UHCC 0204 TaxID=2590009 RepID=UPI00144710C4|nr:hypothetical protein [Anabaena sp. UHCC 0204]MTJ07115.1 hypothetical protein [Anabaena sp. UHCC 0204]
MRYIDLTLITIPDGWVDEADMAAKEVLQGDAEIDDFSYVWQKLKPALEMLVGKKCWYCEEIQSRSDKEVEHFRPKKRVTGARTKHSGYTWLAFNYTNYRYSCGYCNKRRKDSGNNNKLGGKGNYFPLLDENKRAYKLGDEAYEIPKLLDPCVEADVKLLDFNEDGTPSPIPSANDIEQDRVKVSIELYHLKHSEIVEERKALARYLEDLISDADYFFNRIAKGDNTAIKKFEQKLNTLKTAINIMSRFSLFSERYIIGKRHLIWIEFVFK